MFMHSLFSKDSAAIDSQDFRIKAPSESAGARIRRRVSAKNNRQEQRCQYSLRSSAVNNFSPQSTQRFSQRYAEKN